MTAFDHQSSDIRAGTAPEVRRRLVFYIPGFDPAPVRRYRELYRREGAEQARISGYHLGLTPGAGKMGWQVQAQIDGVPVQSEVRLLVWSDIVRDRMGFGVAATYGLLLRTLWIYLSDGTLGRLLRLRKGPAIAIAYPVVILLAELALALLPGLGLVLTGRALFGPAGGWGGLALGAIAAIALLQFFRRHDGRIRAYWLMQDYAWSARLRGAYPPELEQRLGQFVATLRAALMEKVDEVLVVGHSSGAIWAISVLADLMRAGLPAGHPPLGFLSLGQMVPMLSFLPEARRLRRDLHDLSQCADLTWVDVTAPGDGCSFALCDPVAVSGVAPAEGKLWPLVLSCAFSQTLSPERWNARRWRWFDLHFQYLQAFDRPGDYDYFRITAGPSTLASRFRGRSASKSRIERPCSAHRTMI